MLIGKNEIGKVLARTEEILIKLITDSKVVEAYVFAEREIEMFWWKKEHLYCDRNEKR